MRASVYALLLVALTSAPVSAQTSADVLSAPLAPRALAMGEAGTALADDVLTGVYNPAGLGWVRHFQVGLNHAAGLIDSTQRIALAAPIKAGGTLGLGVLYRGLPEIANEGAVDPAVPSSDLVVNLGYGLKLNYLATALDGWNAGVNVKWIKSQIGEFAATALAVDLGTQWVPADEVRIGAVVRNLGAPIKYLETANALPADGRLGAAWRAWEQASHRVWLAAEGSYAWEDAVWTAQAGLEYTYRQMLSVRVGYQQRPDSIFGGISAGAGARFNLAGLRLQADYAYVPVWFSGQTMVSEHFVALILGF